MAAGVGRDTGKRVVNTGAALGRTRLEIVLSRILPASDRAAEWGVECAFLGSSFFVER
jgi:hypothetical protein